MKCAYVFEILSYKKKVPSSGLLGRQCSREVASHAGTWDAETDVVLKDYFLSQTGGTKMIEVACEASSDVRQESLQETK